MRPTQLPTGLCCEGREDREEAKSAINHQITRLQFSRNMKAFPVIGRLASLGLLAILIALVATEIRADKSRPGRLAYQEERQQPSDGNNNFEGQYGSDSAEQVDKLASVAGDLYWPAIMPQLPTDWYQQALAGRLHQLDAETFPLSAAVAHYQQSLRAEKRQPASSFRYTGITGFGGDSEPSWDTFGAPSYRAYVSDFRPWSRHLASPVREGRAFKPKLMSTARGFGKRAAGPDGNVAYSDLLAAADSAIMSNGKMSGKALR